jgi:putative membrane protein (TIGR04086 family)
MTSSVSKLRWGRIVIGAFLMEVALIAVAVPLNMLGAQDLLLYIVAPACFIAAFVFGLWTARGASSNFILHGTLVGVLASVIYIALTWNQTLPLVYHLSHLLKIIGGAAGGALAARQVRAAAATTAAKV